ncbi:MAG: WD40 repeat domain-containing protein [Cyanobacteria bacterium P01_E01_bin.6]
MSRVSRSKLGQSQHGASQKGEFERSHHITLADYITALVWSQDGTLLTAASSAGEVTAWDWEAITMASGGHVTRADVKNVFATQAIPLLAASPNHAISCLDISTTQLVAAGGQDGTVSVWNAQSPDGSKGSLLGDGNHWIDQLTWHPTRDYLAFSAGPCVQVWDVPAQQQIATLNFDASSALGIAWHPSADLLAISGHGGVKFWNSVTWEEESYQLEVPGASISLDWSPDGTYLASGNLDRTLSVLHLHSPPPWLMQGFPGKVRCVSWSPNYSDVSITQSPQVAAACANGVTIWEQESDGKTWHSSVLEGHRGTVQAIAYHPTQFLLASGAADGQVCLWHRAKKLSQRLKTKSPGVSCLAWHPDGHGLAVGCADGTIELWIPSQRGRGFQ